MPPRKRLDSLPKNDNAPGAERNGKEKRSYLRQSDMPSASIEEALRVAEALLDDHAGGPATPLKIAQSLNLQPASGQFRMLCGASEAYGFTSGSAKAESITVLDRALDILRSDDNEARRNARRAAFLAPRVVSQFLTKYDKSPIPREDIGSSVIADLGIPKDKAQEVFTRIVQGADSEDLLRTIKEKKYVDLSGAPSSPQESYPLPAFEGNGDRLPDGEVEQPATQGPPPLAPPANGSSLDDHADARRKRVFVTHGKDQTFVEPIRKLLRFGELEPVVSVERQSVSQPVPDKVMADMRGCGAAIIHVADELRLLDQEAEEHILLNPNVLIEIGAALALYGRRFVLLVKEGISLPSNLQGLYEVRYTGDTLDGNATIRLLEAINDIKNHSLPE